MNIIRTVKLCPLKKVQLRLMEVLQVFDHKPNYHPASNVAKTISMCCRIAYSPIFSLISFTAQDKKNIMLETATFRKLQSSPLMSKIIRQVPVSRLKNCKTNWVGDWKEQREWEKWRRKKERKRPLKCHQSHVSPVASSGSPDRGVLANQPPRLGWQTLGLQAARPSDVSCWTEA